MSEPSARLTSMLSYGIRSKITWAMRRHVTFLVGGGVHRKRHADERAFLQKLTASQLSCSLRPTATDTPVVLHVQAPGAARAGRAAAVQTLRGVRAVLPTPPPKPTPSDGAGHPQASGGHAPASPPPTGLALGG